MKKIVFLLFVTASIMAQDWANLSRFAEENKKINVNENSESRVVFMGNSITEGWIKSDPDFFKKNNFVNRGISGQTTPQMLLRFRQDVINLKPAAVVILAGTNDLAGNTGPTTIEAIEGNLISMCELAKLNGIKVILCSILPAYDYWWNPGVFPTEKIITINSWIKSYATENNFGFVDYFSATADAEKALDKRYSGDGIHPNEVGYSVMKKLVLSEISKVLNTKN
ncbi:MAG: SGNH/GDSL hydrolase family protein [Ignavibacteriales bacterium]